MQVLCFFYSLNLYFLELTNLFLFSPPYLASSGYVIVHIQASSPQPFYMTWILDLGRPVGRSTLGQSTLGRSTLEPC
jgi:hypothetical protein